MLHGLPGVGVEALRMLLGRVGPAPLQPNGRDLRTHA